MKWKGIVGDGRKNSSQSSIKLILNLTEQLSMHSFDLEKWKAVKDASHARGRLKEKTVCTEQNYFLFYLFYFIKVYTDFISKGKEKVSRLRMSLFPGSLVRLTHKATTSSALQQQKQ